MDVKTFENGYVWKILEAYYRERSVVDNQVASFDDFVTFGMQEIVDQESTLAVGKKYIATFGQISLAPPQVIEEDRTLRGSQANLPWAQLITYILSL